MKKYVYIIPIIIILIILSYLFYEVEEEITFEPEEIEIKEELIFVEIKGAIKEPNVYEVTENSRVIDVIEKAGGLKTNADTSLLNLSKKAFDEMIIIVYTKEQVKLAKNNINKQDVKTIEIIKYLEKDCTCIDDQNDACINEQIYEESGLVNLNTASKEQLMTLPGIGESKANSIIDYRRTNQFNEISDITNVSGIGASTFENLKEHISV